MVFGKAHALNQKIGEVEWLFSYTEIGIFEYFTKLDLDVQ